MSPSAPPMTGRHAERRLLLESIQREEPQFVAIYGRRRVGKTYLVRQTLSEAFAFEHVGMASASLSDQLLHFRDSLLRNGLRDCPPLASWHDAFLALERLLDQPRPGRNVVFLDELPWLDTPRSRFLPELEHFWNARASLRKNLVLVVCGSASSWMVSNLVRNRGGLHNRLTRQILLRPFTLRECADYAAARGLVLSPRDICSAYMALGGVPWYWSLLEKGLSVAQNLDALFFAEGAPLAPEHDALFASLFRHSEHHRRIVDALAAVGIGADRATLLARTGLPDNGVLSRCLEELEQCGFVRQYTPYGKAKKGALWQLLDPLVLFHRKFLASRPRDERFWPHSLGSGAQNTWSGLAFERVCLAHVPQIKQALQIAGVLVHVASWRHLPDAVHPHGTQIDLLLDRADRVVNVCEMKWSAGPYAIDKLTADNFRAKLETFRTVAAPRRTLHLTLVTPDGVLPNAHSSIVQSQVTLDDLFADIR